MAKFSIDYHDSYLISIGTDVKKRNIEIICTDGKNKSILRFINVKRSEFNAFTIGNIILSIELITGEALTDNIVDDSSFVHLLGVEKESQYFSKIVNEIRDELLVYVSISTSYGCYGDVICEKIEEITPEQWDPWKNTELLKQ